MSSNKAASNTTAPTQFLEVKGLRYAYRRFEYPDSFTKQAAAFLSSDSRSAVY